MPSSITVENHAAFLNSVPDAAKYYGFVTRHYQIEQAAENSDTAYHLVQGQENKPMEELTDLEIEYYKDCLELDSLTSSPLMMLGQQGERNNLSKQNLLCDRTSTSNLPYQQQIMQFQLFYNKQRSGLIVGSR